MFYCKDNVPYIPHKCIIQTSLPQSYPSPLVLLQSLLNVPIADWRNTMEPIRHGVRSSSSNSKLLTSNITVAVKSQRPSQWTVDIEERVLRQSRAIPLVGSCTQIADLSQSPHPSLQFSSAMTSLTQTQLHSSLHFRSCGY